MVVREGVKCVLKCDVEGAGGGGWISRDSGTVVGIGEEGGGSRWRDDGRELDTPLAAG